MVANPDSTNRAQRRLTNALPLRQTPPAEGKEIAIRGITATPKSAAMVNEHMSRHFRQWIWYFVGGFRYLGRPHVLGPKCLVPNATTKQQSTMQFQSCVKILRLAGSNFIVLTEKCSQYSQ